MKRLILFSIIFLSFVCAKAQTWDKVAGHWEYKFMRWDSAATLPADTLASALPNSIAIKGGVLYYKPTGGAWTAVSGSGGSGAIWGVNITGTIANQTDLINLLNQKINVHDTASMLAPYLRSAFGVKYADTSSMLSVYLRSALGVKYTDTSGMLSAYLRSALFTKAGIGLGNVVNSLQVINLNGFTSLGIYTFAGLPAAGSGPTMAYTTDSNRLYYNTGSAYVAITGGSGGSTIDSSLMLSKHQAILTYVPLSNYTQHAIDSLIGFTPYNSTNPNGYISGNQVISLTNGGDVTGAATGSVSLSVSNTVVGIRGVSVPAPTAGILRYNGSVYNWDNTHYYSSGDTATTIATLLAVKDTATSIRGAFLPLVWGGNQNVTGNSDTLKINTGIIQTVNGGLNIAIGNGSIYATSITGFIYNIGVVGTDANPAWLLAVSGPTGGGSGYPIEARHDSMMFYPNVTTAKIKSDGSATFSTHITGVTESISDSSNFQASTAYVKKLLAAFTPGSGTLNRIGLIDSLSRVPNGLQVVGTSIYAQTSSNTQPGLMSALQYLELDSLYRGLKKDSTKLGWAGTGTHLIWASNAGDSLYSKTLAGSYGFTFVTQADSTVQAAIDSTKWITISYFNAHQTSGTTNLTLLHQVSGDSIKSSTGTGVLVDTASIPFPGLVSLYQYARIQHTLVFAHNPSGLGDSTVYGNVVGLFDSIVHKNFVMGTGMKDSTTLNNIFLKLDTAYTDSRYAKSGQSGYSDSTSIIVSGSSSTISDHINIVRINPSTTLSSYTLTLPTNWHPTNDIVISFGGSITSGPVVNSLTIIAGSGQTLLQSVTPSSGIAGEIIRYHLLSGTIDQRTN